MVEEADEVELDLELVLVGAIGKEWGWISNLLLELPKLLKLLKLRPKITKTSAEKPFTAEASRL